LDQCSPWNLTLVLLYIPVTNLQLSCPKFIGEIWKGSPVAPQFHWSVLEFIMARNLYIQERTTVRERAVLRQMCQLKFFLWEFKDQLNWVFLAPMNSEMVPYWC
jgi:hypothetical protein